MAKHRIISGATPQGGAAKFTTIGVILSLVVLVIMSFQISGIKNDLKSISGNVVGSGEGVKEAPKAAAPSGQGNMAPSTDMEDLIDDDDVKGDANAPVTIIEFSDYECPFCARFYQQTYGQILSQYIDTGKVKLVYRDFPLSFHANAQKAAEAAECAGEQGKYYDMHNKLFEEGVTGGVKAFKAYAKEIGLDTEKFDQCLDSGAMASEVAKDMRDGQAAGIRGTPGFIINGKLISGAQPFEVFKNAIDAELAK